MRVRARTAVAVYLTVNVYSAVYSGNTCIFVECDQQLNYANKTYSIILKKKTHIFLRINTLSAF